MTRPALFVSGPTACGKSGLAVELAKQLSGEVISVDSVQLYRGFDVGSAKISEPQMQGVAHHLLSVKSPSELCNAAEYLRLARHTKLDIESRAKQVVFAGGTTMYITALIHGLAELPETSPELRSELQRLSNEELMLRLAAVDPNSAASLHPNDRLRVIRAIESSELGGIAASEARAMHAHATVEMPALILVMCPARDELYRRINARSVQMVTGGLLEEVDRIIVEFGTEIAPLSTLGYAQALEFREGKMTKEILVQQISQFTRRYAKRQMTFWRNEPIKRGWQVRPEHNACECDFQTGLVRVGNESSGPANRPQKGFCAWSLDREELVNQVRQYLSTPREGVELWYISVQ